METFVLKNKPLFQSTLGDLVEVLKEELGFVSESGNDERAIPSHLVVNIMSGA